MTERHTLISKAVQHDLPALAKSQAWVKGAVNYDEDLHFSTYYLRASCSAVTLPLYPGYSSLIASYEGFNETYYLLKQECHDSAVAIVERALRRPEWLPGILAKIRTHSDALGGIFDTDTSATTLQRLSDAKLLALYRRHDSLNRALYVYARLPEALDRGDAYFTEYLMNQLRKCGMSAAETGAAFAVLSEPAVPSVLAQEILAFNEIVQYSRKHPSVSHAGIDGAGRARMFLHPEVFQRLDRHRQQWEFLSYHGYGRRQLATLDQYIARLQEQLENPDTLADGTGLVARCENAAMERKKLLRHLKVDAAHAALFEVYPEIGAAKLYRRNAQLRNFYFLDMLLAEIARRIHVNEWTVRCMLPEEVIVSLKAGKLVDPEILRRLDGCVYANIDGHESVLTGKEMNATREAFQVASHRRTSSHVLKGVVACRGKISGPCKVIIRADDCREGFPKGSILVSESTDPDLVPFLRAASGVFTEQGGVTSHAAIICRELGIPTIIGVEGLLDRVRDGDWIEMDAEQGIVTLAEKHARTNKSSPKTLKEQSAETVGAKAYNLGIVRSHGFNVPPFAVLEFAAVRRATNRIESPHSQKLIHTLLAELGVTNGEKLAVRSSAVCEDRENGSCAGAYNSVLNVGRNQLGAALCEFTKGNRIGRNGLAYSGSVIVQHMIEGECAGVCLTRDNRTGNRDAVIIEMAAGINSGVTAGTIRPDRIVVDRLTGDILDDERISNALHNQSIDIAALVRQFLTLESHFGKPLDIEWALSKGKLYILQARPIVETHCDEMAGANGR